jgi:hypothetical protein
MTISELIIISQRLGIKISGKNKYMLIQSILEQDKLGSTSTRRRPSSRKPRTRRSSSARRPSTRKPRTRKTSSARRPRK